MLEAEYDEVELTSRDVGDYLMFKTRITDNFTGDLTLNINTSNLIKFKTCSFFICYGDDKDRYELGWTSTSTSRSIFQHYKDGKYIRDFRIQDPFPILSGSTFPVVISNIIANRVAFRMSRRLNNVIVDKLKNNIIEFLFVVYLDVDTGKIKPNTILKNLDLSSLFIVFSNNGNNKVNLPYELELQTKDRGIVYTKMGNPISYNLFNRFEDLLDIETKGVDKPEDKPKPVFDDKGKQPTDTVPPVDNGKPDISKPGEKQGDIDVASKFNNIVMVKLKAQSSSDPLTKKQCDQLMLSLIKWLEKFGITKDNARLLIFQFGISFSTSKENLNNITNNIVVENDKGGFVKILKIDYLNKLYGSIPESHTYNLERVLLRHYAQEILILLRSKVLEWPRKLARNKGIFEQYAYMACDFFDTAELELTEAETTALTTVKSWTMNHYKKKRQIVNSSQLE